ncbi:Uncharacterised protein [Dermatophilus congolensis]|uniref:Uncharacterized protein n=1 Tax=Dermatophilus congolensis TaxID=1863 RepID=A0AA46BPG3_9MICO|nr:Uncharacterised protein [Dermatophilus congolensis]STD15233.1 Uncharacterised protein [Dermatophilus congolensis]
MRTGSVRDRIADTYPPGFEASQQAHGTRVGLRAMGLVSVLGRKAPLDDPAGHALPVGVVGGDGAPCGVPVAGLVDVGGLARGVVPRRAAGFGGSRGSRFGGGLLALGLDGRRFGLGLDGGRGGLRGERAASCVDGVAVDGGVVAHGSFLG